jgi:hypothetical protein
LEPAEHPHKTNVRSLLKTLGASLVKNEHSF